jgi:hypothetical protein
VPELEPHIRNGLRAGVQRATERLGFEVAATEEGRLDEAHALTVAACAEYQTRAHELNPSAVEMVAEWVAVGTIVRSAHGEPPLAQSDVSQFLPAAEGILNTLFCPPPS